MRLPLIAVLFVLLSLSGCSMFGGKDKGPVYKSAERTKQLEIPPDLVRPETDDTYVLPGDTATSARELEQADETATAAAAATATAVAVLPEYTGMRLEHDGPLTWLVVEATPEQLWPGLQSFWETQGLTLKKADPKLGTMETDWAERRMGVEKGGLAGYFERYDILDSLRDSGLRDKFLIRLAPQGENETAVFFTHRGAEEIPVGESDFRWISRPSDPHLVAELVTSLMVYMGESKEKATEMVGQEVKRLPRSEVVDYEDGPALRITGEADYVWRRLGMVLDSSGLVVDDTDKKKGIYYITYLGDRAERGFLNKLFGTAEGPLDYEEEYQIRLKQVEDYFYATAHDKEGQRLTSKNAREALTLIKDAFN
jgi:outer membrane protein assembly factor BamC